MSNHDSFVVMPAPSKPKPLGFLAKREARGKPYPSNEVWQRLGRLREFKRAKELSDLFAMPDGIARDLAELKRMGDQELHRPQRGALMRLLFDMERRISELERRK